MQTAHELKKQSWICGAISSFVVFSITLGVSSCGLTQDLSPLGLRTNPSASPSAGWQSPVAADLGTFGTAYVQYQPLSFPSPVASPTGAMVPQSVDVSFLDHQIAFNEKRAVWVGSLADASGFRAYGRVFTPKAQASGNPAFPDGWSPVGAGFGILDNGNLNGGVSEDIHQIAVGLNPAGSALSIFSGSAVLNQFQSSAISGMSGAWGYFTSNIGAVIPARPFPLNGRNRPAGGKSMDIAWNSSGEAFAAYVSTSALNEAYVQRYNAFAGWDAPAATTAVNIGRQVVQVQMLNDGAGVTALWKTEFTASNQLIAGHSVSCAINNEILRCWGKASDGALGRPATCTAPVAPNAAAIDAPAPADVRCLGQFSVVSASAGQAHTCAVVSDPNGVANNSVYCWGENGDGQLGNGTTTDSEIPLAVAATWGAENPLLISAGDTHTCLVTDDGTPTNRVYCWGNNADGAIGIPVSPDVLTPNLVPALPLLGSGSIPGISSGNGYTCIIDGTVSVVCWGKNNTYQITSFPSATELPTNMQSSGFFNFSGNNLSPIQLASGRDHSCMRIRKTTAPFAVSVYCWGSNTYGALGTDGCSFSLCGATNPNNYVSPAPVSIATGAISISSGESFSCAIHSNQSMSCWGRNQFGQLGAGSTSTEVWDANPTAVLNVSGASAVASSLRHTCAIDSQNRAWCWGTNVDGQLGDALTPGASAQSTPVVVGQPFDCASGKCLFSAWSADGNFSNRRLISENVETFSAATDGLGNIVAAMIRRNPAILPTACSTSAANCHFRAYAAVRNTLGQWLAPAQIDTGLSQTVTTHYQPPPTASAQYAATQDYSTPGVAFLGNTKFLVAYGYTDVTSLASRIGAIQVRGYTVGTGWDSTPTTIGSVVLSGPQTNLYRQANDLKMVSDGLGSALLLVHSVIPSANNFYAWGREMGFQVYRYSSGSWVDSASPYQTWDHGVVGCPIRWSPCGSARMEAAVFSGGEAVVAFPAPADSTLTKLRLFSVERK